MTEEELAIRIERIEALLREQATLLKWIAQRLESYPPAGRKHVRGEQ